MEAAKTELRSSMHADQHVSDVYASMTNWHAFKTATRSGEWRDRDTLREAQIQETKRLSTRIKVKDAHSSSGVDLELGSRLAKRKSKVNNRK